jgi:hypothetical protein
MKGILDFRIDEKFFEVTQRDKLPVDKLAEYEQICLSVAKKMNVNQTVSNRFVDAKQVTSYEQESETWLLLNVLLQVNSIILISLLTYRVEISDLHRRSRIAK